MKRAILPLSLPMLRYAFNRLLWSIPTLFGITIVVFALTTFLPEPRELVGSVAAPAHEALDELDEQVHDLRRDRFLDLPRFFNNHPGDVKVRAEDALAALARGGVEEKAAAVELARLGGAALPYVLPQLSTEAPAVRLRIARALVPVAARMGRFDASEYESADKGVAFWMRFWEDHAIDFTDPTRRRVVDRLVRHGGSERERDLFLLDTFVLSELIPQLAESTRRDTLTQLTEVASRATGKNLRLHDDASAEEVRAVVAAWQSFWFVYEDDFVRREGVERVATSVTATRYGRWMLGALFGKLANVGGEKLSLSEKLWRRFLVTLGLLIAALALSLALAIPLGALAATRKGSRLDRGLAGVLFLLYAIPGFVLAQGIATFAGVGSRGILAAMVLACGTIAVMSRAQRAAMLEVLSSDYVRTARAKGVPEFRVIVVHALRNAIMPVLTLAGMQLPALLGGALVVEEAFGLQGLGSETLRAIERNDLAWIVVAVLATAALAVCTLVVSDVLYGFADPRVKQAFRRRLR